MRLLVHTDGGARGNPGPAAVGVVVSRQVSAGDKTERVAGFGKWIGEATNNVAEYTAVAEALTWIIDHTASLGSSGQLTVDFYLDSTLVVNQLNGLFKVKDAHLRELLSRVRILEQDVGGVIRYTSVPREKNRQADIFVNRALDSRLMSG